MMLMKGRLIYHLLLMLMIGLSITHLLLLIVHHLHNLHLQIFLKREIYLKRDIKLILGANTRTNNGLNQFGNEAAMEK